MIILFAGAQLLKRWIETSSEDNKSSIPIPWLAVSSFPIVIAFRSNLLHL